MLSLTGTLLRGQVGALRVASTCRHMHSVVLRPIVIHHNSYIGSTCYTLHRECSFQRERHVLPSTHSILTQHVRCYAKKAKEKKGKEKSGKKGGKPKVALSEEEMDEVVDLHKMNEQMSSMIEGLQKELMENYSLRTNTGTFENMSIETEDGAFPLIQIGQIIQKNPTLIVINMDAAAHYTKDVKTALMKSNLNLNPQQDGSSIFIPLPKVTREHREGLAKSAKMACEKTKEKLKSVQNKYIREVNNQKNDVSSDLIHNLQEHIRQTTKTFYTQAEAILEAKQKELLGG